MDRAALLESLKEILSWHNAINVFLVVTGARLGARIELYTEVGGPYTSPVSVKGMLRYAAILEAVMEVVGRFSTRSKGSKTCLFLSNSNMLEPFFTTLDVARSKDIALAMLAPYDESSYEAYSAIGRILDYETISKTTFRRVYTPKGGVPNWENVGSRSVTVLHKGRTVWGISYCTDPDSNLDHIKSLFSRIRRSFAGIDGYTVRYSSR
jgi:hypothetical protein